jgi:hypothetical protein
MQVTKGSVLVLLSLAWAASLAAWEDGFGQATVSGFIQVWNLTRPGGASPAPTGPLDDAGRAAGGWRADGLYLRLFEIEMGAGLGLPGVSLHVGSRNNLSQASVGDAHVLWTALPDLDVRVGQFRLPFGLEQQLSSAALPTLERALVYGYSNYGHVDAWGLGLLSERGVGLRVDYSPASPFPSDEADLRFALQAGAFYAKSQGFSSVLGGGGRVQLRWGLPQRHVQVGTSVFAGRGRSERRADHYAPLGRPEAWIAVAELGRPILLTWGVDAELQVHPLHLQAELALQRAEALERGGGALTGWMELPIPPRGWELYVRLEQAWPGWADGVRAPGALLRGRALGLRARLPRRQNVVCEWKDLEGDGLASAFGGSLGTLQWQAEF